ncbi:MAG: anaphase-promoting complex subunit cdc27 [Chrysothrix sp. TS-e1954]|nr:MAG: anaphase-promoting complex subunit cdc27 [Chrysothrix sp. TS-e1954]
MAPSTLQLTAQLRQIIWHHLDNNLVDNALFLAGRLQAIDARSLDAAYLSALCYLRLGKYEAALDCSRPAALRGTNISCTYLFAQACLSVGRHSEGIQALERSRGVWDPKPSNNKPDRSNNQLRRQEPDTAAIKCLFGKLLHATGDLKRAVTYYAEALELDPFMWDAFERLCDTGTALHTSNIFRTSPHLVNVLSGADCRSKARPEQPSSHRPLQPHAPNEHRSTLASNVPVDHLKAERRGKSQHTRNNEILQSVRDTLDVGHATGIETPASSSANDPSALQSIHVPNGASASHQEPPSAPPRRSRFQHGLVDNGFGLNDPKMHRNASETASIPESEMTEEQGIVRALATGNTHSLKRSASGLSQNPPSTLDQDLVAAPQRRSHRLFKRGPPQSTASTIQPSQDPKRARATGTKGRISTVGRIVSGNRNIPEIPEGSIKEPRMSSMPLQSSSAHRTLLADEDDRDTETVQWLLDLLAKLGVGYYALSRYQCRTALQHFQDLPQQHRETPWVLSQIGKAFYEQGNWAEAAKVFARLRQVVPSRLDDMEVYSTVLWHLKSDSELAFLSHELIESDRLSPQAWCCIGNSFSLQREHDQALKCFKRATQINESFAYGFTLQGHEHVANEEFDKALLAYRKALAADHRHYNGWYGLAKVYEKLGKFDVAERHYMSAACINPNNSILTCCIGMVLERQHKPEPALRFYTQACALCPQSTMARFRKARVLMNLRRNEDALRDFLVLKDTAADESNVHFMLGRVLGRLRRNAEALKHFTTAITLDPKATSYIKETMESLVGDPENEIDDDDEMSQ